MRSIFIVFFLFFALESPLASFAQSTPKSTPNLIQSPSNAPARQANPQANAPVRQANPPQANEQQNELKVPESSGLGYPDISSQAVILILLALLPFIVMLMTSFLKMVVSLSLLRSALGVQQTPPNQVINGIALLLTIYVMYPTGLQMYQRSKHLIETELPTQLFSANTAALTLAVVQEAKEPLKDFLIRNSQKKNLESFYKLAMKTFPAEVRPELTQKDFLIVVPAFITTQIKAAFEIGVLIYLPFFVVDLVTSNILLAMQMMMLSPLSISLPLKLLLLVMLDGWTVLLQGLVLSFN
jgi:type III secretion protein R